MILRCTCVHEFQDEHYGKQMRLHNDCRPQGIILRFRCTVCGDVKQVPGRPSVSDRNKKK